MKLSWATTFLLICSTGVTSLPTDLNTDLIARDTVPANLELHDLEKRRGGGGGGGGGRGGGSGGGSGGRSSGSSGSSRGGSTGGRTGGGTGGSTGGGRTSSSSNRGGTTNRGSGVAPSYGGGRYYAGGAATPYSAGRRSPLGVAPFLLPLAAVAFFLPAAWAYGAYAYAYSHHYHYYNETSHQNTSLPVVCVCQEYQECGCDDNNNRTYYESLFNGTTPHNTSDVRVVTVNGTEKIYINGTLTNGTTAESSDSASSEASGLLQASGFWIPVAVVSAMVWGL